MLSKARLPADNDQIVIRMNSIVLPSALAGAYNLQHRFLVMTWSISPSRLVGIQTDIGVSHLSSLPATRFGREKRLITNDVAKPQTMRGQKLFGSRVLIY